MKKFLAIIAIASFAVACNESGEKEPTVDSTTVVAPVEPIVDSVVNVVDSAVNATIDSLKK